MTIASVEAVADRLRRPRERGETTVLHVDGDRSFVDVTAETLEREGEDVSVVGATSAADGVELLRERTVDCVVSAYDLPDGDGLSFLDAVRERHPDLPFVLFPGAGSEAVASEAISAGVTDYVRKARSEKRYAALADRIERAVTNRAAGRTLVRGYRALEAASQGIGILDADGHYEYVNPAYAEVYDLDPADVVGTHWAERYPPREAERFRDEVLPGLADAGRWSGESVGLTADGDPVPQSLELTSMECGGHVCVMTDATGGPGAGERAQAVDRVTDAVAKVDADWRFTFVGDLAEEIYGRAEADLLGRDFWEVFESARGTRFETTYRTAMEEREPAAIEAHYEAFDEWFHVEVYPDDGGGLSFYFREITDRKERESELEQYETVVETVADGIYTLDTDYRFTTVNGRLVELTGYEREELLGSHISLLFPDEETLTVAQEKRDNLVEGECEVESLETDIVTADGDTVPCEMRGRLLVDDGEWRGTAGVVRDVSERRRRERELERSERRYRVLAEHFPNGGVFLFDDEFRYEVVSGSGFDPIDTAPEDLEGNTIYEVEPYDETDVARMETVMSRTLDGETVLRELTYEGHVYELRSAPIRDDDGEVTAGLYITQDVTERRRRKRALERQNQRLDRFASLVSHDLRNPLNVASGHLELALRADDPDDGRLERVQEAHERMETLIDELLTLARDPDRDPDPEPVCLRSVAVTGWETVETRDAALASAADLTLLADASRLRRVLENLFRNAVEHGGPDVEVTVGALPGERGFYVADDGPGIPPDERDRVFDPGYTTEDGGTGYGLDIVATVADAHGWSVEVTESDAGGARFEFAGVERP